MLGVFTATVKGEEVGCMGDESQLIGVPDSVEGPAPPEFIGVFGRDEFVTIVAVATF